MGLADDIRALCDRVLADLNTAHDYYTDTKSHGTLSGGPLRRGKRFRSAT